jgi:hypothetical protein
MTGIPEAQGPPSLSQKNNVQNINLLSGYLLVPSQFLCVLQFPAFVPVIRKDHQVPDIYVTILLPKLRTYYHIFSPNLRQPLLSADNHYGCVPGLNF